MTDIWILICFKSNVRTCVSKDLEVIRNQYMGGKKLSGNDPNLSFLLTVLTENLDDQPAKPD